MPETKEINTSQKDDFEAIRAVLNGDNSQFSLLDKKYHRIIAALIRKMVRKVRY